MKQFLSSFFRVFFMPSPTKVLRQDIAQAELDRMQASMNREHFVHSERMLVARVARLKGELAKLEGVSADVVQIKRRKTA